MHIRGQNSLRGNIFKSPIVLCSGNVFLCKLRVVQKKKVIQSQKLI